MPDLTSIWFIVEKERKTKAICQCPARCALPLLVARCWWSVGRCCRGLKGTIDGEMMVRQFVNDVCLVWWIPAIVVIPRDVDCFGDWVFLLLLLLLLLLMMDQSSWWVGRMDGLILHKILWWRIASTCLKGKVVVMVWRLVMQVGGER